MRPDLMRLLALLTLGAFAFSGTHPAKADAATDYAAGQELARKNLSGVATNIKNGSAAAEVPTYTQTPTNSMSGYYKGGTDQAVSQKKQYCASHPEDATCGGVNDGSKPRPPNYIKLSDPALGGMSVARDPSLIVGDMASTYSACTTTTPQLLQPATFTETTCKLDFAPWVAHACAKTLSVLSQDHYSCNIGDLLASSMTHTGGIPTNWHNTEAVYETYVKCVDPGPDGRTSFWVRVSLRKTFDWGIYRADSGWFTVTVDMSQPTPLPGQSAPILSTFWGSNEGGPYSIYAEGPGCDSSNACAINIHFARPGMDHGLLLTYRKRTVTQKAGDYWTNACKPYEAQAVAALLPPDGTNVPNLDVPVSARVAASQCVRTNSTCTDGPSTKVIEGIEQFRKCWAYSNQFECSTLAPTSTCNDPSLATCKQTGPVTCLSSQPGGCLQGTAPFECPSTPATYTAALNCGPSSFCGDGSCYDQNVPPNPDFARAVTYLEAIKQAGQTLDPNTLKIFRGDPKSCKHKVVGLFDCCDTSDDPAVLGEISGTVADGVCAKTDQTLALDRSQGKCHYVGKYCNKKVLGICVESKESYCCYTSRLARLINEQGRLQLARGWGTPQAPDCEGFSITELQALDFAKMDLSEFYKEIVPTLPTLADTQNGATSNTSNCYYGAGKC